jgi:acetyl-CoA carboxylase biotin carboxyl carrier protein
MDNKIFGLFDIEDISRLADVVRDKELSEITLVDGEKTITVKGKKCPPPPPVGFPVPPVGVVPTAETTAPVPVPEKEKIDGNVVKAPIVGTFYSSPSPDKPPFVKVGDTVKKGDVIMIIESMKLMNEIQSDFDGKVKEILVENGAAVEYDQPVMIIG